MKISIKDNLTFHPSIFYAAAVYKGSLHRLVLENIPRTETINIHENRVYNQPRTQGLSVNNPGTGRKVLNSDWPIKNA